MASTNATNASSPIDLKELDDLFSWNPPRLVLDPRVDNKTPSISTRPPAYFDRHFSTKLALKRVVHLPSLVEDIAKTVDSTLDAAKHTLPEVSVGDFYTTKERKKAVRQAERFVRDEAGVSEFYAQTTGTFCPVVASTLALHPTAPSWMALIRWTRAVSSSSHAIMDAELTLYAADDAEDAELREEIMKTIEGGRHRILEAMRRTGSPLMAYEFKSLSAGPVEVMTAVPDLDEFQWTYCESPEHPCSNPEHQKMRNTVEAIVSGPDALHPPWNLPVPESSSKEKVQITQTTQASPSFSQEEPGTSSVPEPAGSKKRKRTQGSEMSEKQKGKRRQKADVDSRAHSGHHDVSAHDLVQQAWVKATKVDTSLMVLHSGNHELIGVRHRESQTLFVSDPIEPHKCTNPGYGKLHVGIGIASIIDMFDRKQQQSPHADSGGEGPGGGSGGGGPGAGGPSTGGGNLVRGKGGKGKGGRGRGAKKRTTGGLGGGGNPIEDELAIKEMIYSASKCHTLHMFLKYDVYDSPVPASFIRSLPLPMPQNCPSSLFSPDNHTHGLDECMMVIVTSEIGQGATGVALRGTLKPENMEGAGALDVVVKLAFDNGQRDSLKEEYKLYLHLRAKEVQQGITPIIGFFDDNADGSACALVMLYAGVPISDLGRNLTATECQVALSTLESIHSAGVLHDDIRPNNVLIGDSGVTVIDFGNSTQCSSKKAKGKEYAYLQSILQGLAGESQ